MGPCPVLSCDLKQVRKRDLPIHMQCYLSWPLKEHFFLMKCISIFALTKEYTPPHLMERLGHLKIHKQSQSRLWDLVQYSKSAIHI